MKNTEKSQPHPAIVGLDQFAIFLSDMDGTMTDGARYLSDGGPEIKKFNIPDGMGLLCLRMLGKKIGLVTAESGGLVQKRAESLKMDIVLAGVRDKLSAVKELSEKTGVPLAKMAFIGDDINDFNLLSQVGFAACPANAQDLIKSIPGIRVLSKAGGEGAVREFINLLAGEENLLKAWQEFANSAKPW